ncbi:MAG: EF-P lysine aminoacylase GenX [Gammaproteobacteria bacterium]|nr:EF-P lysine aminoacylase GenX [Gammaproteobacteria bacterium]
MSNSFDFNVLHERAKLYYLVRLFFEKSTALEVETPILSSSTTTEPFIDSFDLVEGNQRLFLHTSPEFYMKRLLTAVQQDIYQLVKVFRREESGNKHLREFSLLEWYRVNIDEQALIDDVANLMQSIWVSFRPDNEKLTVEKISYQTLFENYYQINPHQTTISELKACAKHSGLISLETALGDEKDRWLDALMSCVLESNLGGTHSDPKMTFIYDYPKSQCALARISKDEQGNQVAKRFELYIAGVELANGFYELNDEKEQRRRFNNENSYRRMIEKEQIPLDEEFLNDLDTLPECAGVALGIDRLLMLLLGKNSVHEVVYP